MRFLTYIKLLTPLLISSVLITANASIVIQTKHDNFLRWGFFVKRDQIVIDKKKNKVHLNTLNRELFDKLKNDFAGIAVDKKYIQRLEVREIDAQNNVATLIIHLANNEIDVFSFYQKKSNKLVMDFWRENVTVSSQSAAVVKEGPKAKKLKIVQPIITKNKKRVIKPAIKDAVVVEKKVEIERESPYRDYRYGASFWWNYEPISPKIKKVINLDRKTPEMFYPISDREYEKSDREAHLQATINMYRKKKWGRMYQSMKLYAQTYGEHKNSDLNEYIKANALLRINFEKRDRATVKQAVNILENIASATKNYSLKKGIHKYLISYFLAAHENVKAYQLAKAYYVETKEQFDIEESEYAAGVILYCLAQMNQLDVIDKLLKEQTIRKLIPTQLMYAYRIYTMIKLDDIKGAIKLYEKVKDQLGGKIHHTIVFNIAECYFRTASFEIAINLFDKFVAESSYVTSAERARLRIALAYEILEKDFEKTTELYRNTINRAQSEEVRYEAKVRYVALKSVRKKNIDDSDREVRVFLERKHGRTEEFPKNLRKILWLVRLRTFVVDKKYTEALAYLNAIPLNTLRPAEKRVFEGDGAEIVSGILRQYYKEADYSRVVQAWQVYKERYINKVASDPMLNYLVGRSYVKLGLFKGFEKQISRFEKVKSTPARTFPVWIDRSLAETSEELLLDLKIAKNIKLKNWKHAKRVLDNLERKIPSSNRVNFYRAILADHENKYPTVVRSFEKYLSQTTGKELHDNYDIAQMMQSYTNALYQQGKIDRFKKVAEAMLNDTKHISTNKYMTKVKERVSYLFIELVAAENTKESTLEVEPMILNFKKSYKKSLYLARLNYLLGVSMIASERTKEGEDIFKKVLEAKDASEYIKELVRSELTDLKIINRTI